jgi:glucuronoarabinoxylan endo-1,4-beta-xylanase
MALVGLESGRPVPQDPYFAMRHYARYTDPGFTRVAASSTDPTVLSSAWLSPEGGALTVVLVNAGLSTQAVSLDVGDRRAFSLSRTVFDGRERMAELGTMTSGASITLPPRSVATARFE